MKKIVLLAFGLILCSFVNGQDCYQTLLDAGINQYNAGHYETAIKKWQVALKCDDRYLTVSETQTLNDWIAKAKNPPQVVTSPKLQSVEPEMVFVQGGTFQMGEVDSYNGSRKKSQPSKDEHAVHFVTLSDYYIGKYEVTQVLWKVIMGYNPSDFKGDNLPVENVNWDNIQDFIKRLNYKTGKSYRLPTEAEWEFAARGGVKSNNYKYSGSNDLNSVAWHDENADKTTHQVGQKQANELDIYDMSGNVYEACNDWYDENYYKNSPSLNPQGAVSGSFRVYRGGCFYYPGIYCTVSYRGRLDPMGGGNSLGFRLALSYLK